MFKRKSDLDNSNNKKIKNMNDETNINSCDWISLEEGSVEVYKYKFVNKIYDKIAAFDLDCTLIVPKSKKKFSQDRDDWKLISNQIVNKIKNYIEDDYCFVIFTNQGGVKANYISIDDLKTKIQNICKLMNLPCLTLMALDEDKNRKPCNGMFNLFINHFNQKHDLDLKKSFYVGDAMGRNTSSNKDHSAADLLFAVNCKLPFLPPESFLNGLIKPKIYTENNILNFKIPKFNQRQIFNFDNLITLKSIERNLTLNTINELIENIENFSNKSHLIMFIGFPGSGKSTFYKKYLIPKNYDYINRDTLGTKEKCEKLFENLIKKQENNLKLKICLDQTNLDKKTRSFWIDKCKKNNLDIIGINFNIDFDHCLHNIKYRKYFENKNIPNINKIVLYKMKKQFEEPVLDENFALLFTLKFIPCFDNEDEKSNYMLYLSDK